MKVYKLKTSTEPGVVIIDINSKNLTESEHRLLTRLPGDLFLIFNESITKDIDPGKFSNLYGATWYGIYKGNKIYGVWEALDYLEAVTEYTSISVVTGSWWLGEKASESLRKLQYSGIETSVFESRDLTKEEKAEIYVLKPNIFELAFGLRFKWYRKNDDRGLYSKRTTSDLILFLRPSSIQKMREKISPKVLHSFVGLGIGSFLSSMIPSETYINININGAMV